MLDEIAVLHLLIFHMFLGKISHEDVGIFVGWLVDHFLHLLRMSKHNEVVVSVSSPVSLEIEFLNVFIALFDHFFDFIVVEEFQLQKNFIVRSCMQNVLKGRGKDMLIAQFFLILAKGFPFLNERAMQI